MSDSEILDHTYVNIDHFRYDSDSDDELPAKRPKTVLPRTSTPLDLAKVVNNKDVRSKKEEQIRRRISLFIEKPKVKLQKLTARFSALDGIYNVPPAIDSFYGPFPCLKGKFDYSKTDISAILGGEEKSPYLMHTSGLNTDLVFINEDLDAIESLKYVAQLVEYTKRGRMVKTCKGLAPRFGRTEKNRIVLLPSYWIYFKLTKTPISSNHRFLGYV